MAELGQSLNQSPNFRQGFMLAPVDWRQMTGPDKVRGAPLALVAPGFVCLVCRFKLLLPEQN